MPLVSSCNGFYCFYFFVWASNLSQMMSLRPCLKTQHKTCHIPKNAGLLVLNRKGHHRHHRSPDAKTTTKCFSSLDSDCCAWLSCAASEGLKRWKQPVDHPSTSLCRSSLQYYICPSLRFKASKVSLRP